MLVSLHKYDFPHLVYLAKTVLRQKQSYIRTDFAGELFSVCGFMHVNCFFSFHSYPLVGKNRLNSFYKGFVRKTQFIIAVRYHHCRNPTPKYFKFLVWQLHNSNLAYSKNSIIHPSGLRYRGPTVLSFICLFCP